MKYRYSKLSYFLQFLFSDIAVIFMIWLIYVYGEIPLKSKYTFGAISMPAIIFISYANKFLNQYVETHEDYMSINYMFKNPKLRNAASFGVKYEDVISITCKKIPLIGIASIRLNIKNVPEEIKLTLSYCKHNEMYKNICKNVLGKNPDVNIDSRLLRLIEK